MQLGCRLAIVPMVLFLLAGCGSSAPKCSDSDVKKLVLQVLRENYTAEEILDINQIITIKEESKSCACQAKASFKLKNTEGLSAEFPKELLSGTIAIKYVTRLTDKGEKYVEVYKN